MLWKFIDEYERITSAELRRDRIRREIELRREDYARRLRAAALASGKKRVRRNALRRGFSAVSFSAAAVSAEVDHLATAICGRDAHPAQREQAIIAAECELLVLRVRQARLKVIEQISPLPAREQDPGASWTLSRLE